MAGRVVRSSKLDLRLTPEAREKLQAAAKASRRSVSEFVLESPIMLLARLAAASAWQGRGLGPALLKDAMRRTLQAADIAGIRAFAVHARDERARDFYAHFRFIPSPTDPLYLYVLLKDIRRAAEA